MGFGPEDSPDRFTFLTTSEEHRVGFPNRRTALTRLLCAPLKPFCLSGALFGLDGENLGVHRSSLSGSAKASQVTKVLPGLSRILQPKRFESWQISDAPYPAPCPARHTTIPYPKSKSENIPVLAAVKREPVWAVWSGSG